MSLFRPPIVRSAGAKLDRSLFTKQIPIAAARILDNKNISKYRTQLEKAQDLLKLDRLGSVRSDPDASLASRGGKCLLLKPEVKPGGMRVGCRVVYAVLSFHSSNDMEPDITRSSEGRRAWGCRLRACPRLRLLELLYVSRATSFPGKYLTSLR